MRKRMIIGVVLGIGLGALLSLIGTPVSPLDVLKQPFQSLWGSPRKLNSSVLEVTENIDSVEEATRSLLKPWGVVHVTRRFPSAPADSSH